MSEYVIVTESTTDLTAEQIKEMGITLIPMEFDIDGKSYLDDAFNRTISPVEFYRILKEGKKAVTSQVNMSTYIEVLEPLLIAGKDVLILAFSSALSGTFQSSQLAVEELSEKYPDRKIITVDTRCASMGEGLMVHQAVNLKNGGMAIDELAEWVTNNRLKLSQWFTVDDLNHLKRGGRVSTTAALVGTFLGIKPVLHVDDEGRLVPVSKVRGRRQSLDALVDKMAETYDKDMPQTVFISHGDSLEDANYVADKIRERLNITDFTINFIGPVIGSHSGPGTIALFFWGNKR